MPIYVYKCETCQTESEVFVRSKEEDSNICKICNSIMYRCLSPVPAIYKCGGFYNTDYKNSETTNKTKNNDKSKNIDYKNKDTNINKPKDIDK